MNLVETFYGEQEVTVQEIPDDVKELVELRKEIGIAPEEKPKPSDWQTFRDKTFKVCQNYDLRCMHISLYKKEIPKENLLEIEAYINKESNESGRWRTSIIRDLNIIAPREDFAKRKFAVANNDPIVIDLISDAGTTKPTLVTTWGNDFTWHRRLWGWWVGSMSKALLYLISGLIMMIVGFTVDLVATIIVGTVITILGILKAAHKLNRANEGWRFYTTDSHTYWFERL